MGFGRMAAELYGLGGRFDEEEEQHAAVSRFFADVADSAKSNRRFSYTHATHNAVRTQSYASIMVAIPYTIPYICAVMVVVFLRFLVPAVLNCGSTSVGSMLSMCDV